MDVLFLGPGGDLDSVPLFSCLSEAGGLKVLCGSSGDDKRCFLGRRFEDSIGSL